jgi:hypothetical protein
MYLDVAGANTTSGTAVRAYTSNSTSAQKWRIYPISGLTGVYVIRSYLDTSLALSAPNLANNGGTVVKRISTSNLDAAIPEDCKWAYRGGIA